MYKVAFVVASGEIITYPWMNPQSLFPNHELYDFIIFQPEQCMRLFAEMELGALDGVIFSSNVSNDSRVCNLIECHKDIIENFINQGKGILILLQYHLAKKGKIFNVVSKRIFWEQGEDSSNAQGSDAVYSIKSHSEEGTDLEREQNKIVLTNSKFDLSKVYWDNTAILLSYPNKLSPEIIYKQSQNSRYVNTFAPAYISDYLHAYFSAPFCVWAKTKDNNIIKKPLMIYSLNENKRIIITTIPADLQEHKEFLENLISYITRGKPKAVLWKDESCQKCRGKCDIEDYLKRAKIHYIKASEKEFKEKKSIVNGAKYVLACGMNSFQSYQVYSEKTNGISLPIRTTLNNITGKENKKDEKIVVEIPAASQIEIWANQGFEYLLSRFPQNNAFNNRWDSLYATKQVVLLAQKINRKIPDYITEQIERYLLLHNQDNESFDKVDRATEAAAEICKTLNLNLNFKEIECKDIYCSSSIPHEKIMTASLFDLAQYVLTVNSLEDIPDIYEITARFIVERDTEKASWDDDVITTATVLRALLRIDEDPSINTSIINIVSSCYDDMGCTELTKALSLSIEQVRQSEYDVRKKLEQNTESFQEELTKNTKKIEQNVLAINSQKDIICRNKEIISEYEEINKSLKNKNSRLHAWIVAIGGLLVYLIFMLVAFIIKAFNFEQKQYMNQVIDFLGFWGIGGMIITLTGILVTIILFRVLYKNDIKENNHNTRRKK